MNEYDMLNAYADMMDMVTESGRSAYAHGLTIEHCPYEDRRLQGFWKAGYHRAARDDSLSNHLKGEGDGCEH